jgi:peptidoglycan hydrolase FlgJ
MTGISATSGSALPLQPEAPSDRETLHKTAQAFEAIFVRQMLSTARASNFGNDLFSSQAADTFKSMQDEQFADIASKNGALGFAKVIEAQLAKHLKLSEDSATTNPDGKS